MTGASRLASTDYIGKLGRWSIEEWEELLVERSERTPSVGVLLLSIIAGQ